MRLNRVLAIGIATNGNPPRSTVAVDLSVSGFQVAASFPVEIGQLVSVRLHLRNLTPVEATARAIWSENLDMGLVRMGFQFEEMRSKEDFARLFQYVDKERLNVEALPQDVEPTLELASQVALRSLTDQELDRFAVLSNICGLLNGAYDLQELLERALKITVEATGAERGLILLSGGGNEFDAPAFYAVTRTQNRDYSRSVVDQVLVSGKPLLSLDAQQDERFSASHSLRVMGTRSVLCLPIATKLRNFGMIYLDSSVRAGVLTQSDLRLGTVIAGMAASAIERAENFAQLVQREKMAVIGTLTAGLLHEIVNPLSAVISLGELLHLDSPCELTKGLVVEAQRCNRLIQDLLRMTRKEPAQRSLVHLVPTIQAAVTAIKCRLDEMKVELLLDLEPNSPPVYGNADHLCQVVLNLLSNAIFAAGLRGKVEVQLKTVGDELQLCVIDSGPGIAPGHLGKIFDPFFTTKGAEDGTGLGLSIIARIVNEHGGTAKAGNYSSGGAIFTISLPITKGPAVQATA